MGNQQIKENLEKALSEATRSLKQSQRKGQGLARYAISRGEKIVGISSSVKKSAGKVKSAK